MERQISYACLKTRSFLDCVAVALKELNDAQTAAGGAASDKDRVVKVAVGVGFGCAGLILVFILLLWWLSKSMHRSLLGGVLPPGLGPDTTLLVTDIQNSTRLWEDLSVIVMDQSLRLHHATIRTLLPKHNG